MGFLETIIFENTMQRWLQALLVFVLVYIALIFIKRLIQTRLMRWVRRSNTDLDDFVVDLAGGTRWYFLMALALYLGSLLLQLPQPVKDGLRILVVALALLQAAFWGMSIIDYLVARRLRGDPDPAASATTMSAFKLIAKIALWSVIILLMLENLTGISVNSLIASLGITGVAVALAVQNILGDLFSSVSIAFDKPFVIGDFITVGDFSGTVEAIGLKSTRVRSLSGEQVIFSNSDLLGSRIQNYKRMARRRVAFSLGVTYQTPYEKLAAIPGMVEEIITAQDNVTFDRVHFKSFGDFALNFECVYYVEAPEYLLFMDIQQTINLDIYRRFAEQGIEFAYPTQTLIMEQAA
jgi:small-conductance mechanosensitive channel